MGGEAASERHAGKRRRADGADAAQVVELLARLVKSLLKPAYQANEISREGFKLVARAVTDRAREMAAAHPGVLAAKVSDFGSNLLKCC